MAKTTGVWGIDIGQCALKALKLRETEDGLQAEAFDVVEHPQILSQPDADRDELIRAALEQFLSRNDVSGSQVAVAVPGQSSFTRFVKLPPVEPKKIPDIVRFEAEQQIPFPINDVIWRYQTFQMPDSPDVEVGIFAMKKVDVGQVLQHFREVELPVDVVQMAPLALYNFMVYDGQLAAEGATLLVDVGADKTDLVVADGARIWTRTIQIGGNSFTEALVRAFKLSFPKAEKLKRTAASSKYARQIFQAMRPVFADLVQEIQRSVGYYTSLHRETRFRRLVGLGAGFRLPGLQKFLEQNLGVPVSRVDSFNKLQTAPAVNAPAFDENVLSFAVAYGLALQGLDATAVNTNLLPGEIARQRLWARKQPWFAAAAAVILAVLGIPAYRAYLDKQALSDENEGFVQSQRIHSRLKEKQRQHQQLEQQREQALRSLQHTAELFAHREFWPSVEALISGSVQAVAGDQHLLTTYCRAGTPAGREQALEQIRNIRRSAREMLFVEQSGVRYFEDVSQLDAADLLRGGSGRPSAAEGPAAEGFEGRREGRPSYRPTPPASRGEAEAAKRGYWVVFTGRTPLSRERANVVLAKLAREAGGIAQNLPSVEVVDATFDFGPMGSGLTSGVQGLGDVTVGGGSRDRTEFDRTRRGRFDEWDSERRGTAYPGPSGPGEQVQMPDPLLPQESMAQDTEFVVGLLVAIADDGIDLEVGEQ
jgi:type IV pilus assembly protein PilM